MSRNRMLRSSVRHRSRTLITSVVLALCFGAMVLDGASLPHLHAKTSPGLYNQEHDLTLLAVSARAGAMPVSTAAVPFAALVVALVCVAATVPYVAPTRHTASRAPPTL
jgi:hypothetical protein